MLIHIDKQRYGTKPKEHISIIKPRLQSADTVKDISIEDIIKYIEQGYSVSPSVMSGGCKAENWQKQQLFMVDIDNDNANEPLLSVADALKICTANNLPPAFYYYSFSHSERKPKYRLCFVMNELVTEKLKRQAIIETLIKLFKQSDKGCKNADRVFYGTNKKAVVCDLSATISFENILKLYEPPKANTTYNGKDTELDRLKREFDLFSYMKQRNGKLLFNNSSCAMFEECEICGHKKDLVYYHGTNTFCCFGGGNTIGGSIIDYLIASERISRENAVERFYTLSGITRPTKREHAIKTKYRGFEGVVSTLIELDAYRRYSLNDKGFGELFAEVYKDTCRFNATANSWYFFNGKVWVRDESNMFTLNKAKELSDSLLVYATTIEDEKQKLNYLEYVSKLGMLRFRETMIRDARDIHFLTQADFDKDLDLLNCQNGTLNLRTFEFKPHNPNDLLSKITNVNYEPSIKSDEWEKFIDDVMQGDTEKIRYLQKVLGYSLTADTRLETCFILYGATTRNGKSTLIETLLYMLGNTAGYGMSMKPETLAQKKNVDSRQASGDIARLNGCRFLNASEPPKRMIFDVGLLKSLLGRDSICARHLHEREFEFVPYFKLFINTNFLPLITDDTLFSSGRINVITFDRHFEPQEQDKNLKYRLKNADNLSGILNWCLQGLKLFYEEDAEPPQAVIDANAEYRTNSDKIGNFISECMEKCNGAVITAGSVYDRFYEWCSENGYGAENKRNFFDELKAKNLFSETGTINGKTVKRVVKGYRLVNEYSYTPSYTRPANYNDFEEIPDIDFDLPL